MEVWLVLGIAVAGFIAWVLQPDPFPLLGVYSQPGKWYTLKMNVMRFVIGRRQKQTREASDKEDNLMDSQFGGTGKRSDRELDSKHKLPEDKEMPADAVFFDASNKDGFFFTLGTAQRKNDIINMFFVLRIPGKGVYVAPEMLTNTNVQSVKSDTEWVTKSGFRVKCVEPMRKWTISYKGNVVKVDPQTTVFTEVGPLPDAKLDGVELIPASFELTWDNFGEAFDFDTEVSPTSIAHSLALEPWSRELFDKLKASHQSHYEQFGFLSGSFQIGDDTLSNVRMTSMRDHSITAHRNWTEIRRYIMLIYHLDDGTCIHTSLISMPGVVFTQLEFGYVITPDKVKHAVDRIHLRLADVGEAKGQFPRHFDYTFEAGDLQYHVKVNLREGVSFKMGMDQACQVDENFADYEVNGIKGRGFVEAEYRIQPY